MEKFMEGFPWRMFEGFEHYDAEGKYLGCSIPVRPEGHHRPPMQPPERREGLEGQWCHREMENRHPMHRPPEEHCRGEYPMERGGRPEHGRYPEHDMPCEGHGPWSSRPPMPPHHGGRGEQPRYEWSDGPRQDW